MHNSGMTTYDWVNIAPVHFAMKIRAPYLWENQKIQSSCWNEKCLKMQARMILNVIFSNSSVGWRASQMFEGRPATPVPMGSCIAATNFKALKSSWPYIIIHSKRIRHQQTNKKSKNDAQTKTETTINKHQQVIRVHERQVQRPSLGSREPCPVANR